MKKIVLRCLAVTGITLFMLTAGLYCIMWIFVNGPSQRARELFVLSVRETSAVGFLADIFCSKEEIRQLEQANKQDEDLLTDTSMISINAGDKADGDDNNVGSGDGAGSGQQDGSGPGIGSEKETGQDLQEYQEESISDSVQDSAGGNDIEIRRLTGSTYRGVMMIVKDPSRVMVGVSSETYDEDVPGRKVADMIASYNAVGGVNAGGFDDPNGAGNGGLPIGLVISGGRMLYGDTGSRYEIIGFNNDNVLVVGSMTGAGAIKSGIRDAVSFGPALIVNGETTKASKGGGFNPRTAIGQRKDGAVLLLVIDGRQSASLGATYGDVTRIMLEFGAVNAANLDGGSSSVMYYNGELLNRCCSLYGPREMPNCIIVKG